MKRIINGKKYDTETAAEMGAWNNGADGFEECCEVLYRKTTGEYFLYGEGGPMSKYGERIDSNNVSGGVKIMPLTIDEAKKWAEKHLTGDEYEKIFGEVEE